MAKKEFDTIISNLKQGKTLVGYCRGCNQCLSVIEALQHACPKFNHPALR